MTKESDTPTDEQLQKFIDKESRPKVAPDSRNEKVYKTIHYTDTKELRVVSSIYKDKLNYSIRQYYKEEPDDEQWLPGKGCTFKWEDIDEIIEGLKALKEDQS